jgi:hypothetical protein
MTIHDKIKEICGLDNCGIDEDGNLEFIGTDKQWSKSAEMIEKYEDGKLDEDQIEEIWNELQTELPEGRINKYKN